jgi:hypothetical protein
MEDKYPDSDAVIAAKRMMNMTGVVYQRYNEPHRDITLHL